MKIVNKGLEEQKNAKSNEETDHEMIRSKVASLVKKDLPNTSKGTVNASA